MYIYLELVIEIACGKCPKRNYFVALAGKQGGHSKYKIMKILRFGTFKLNIKWK